MLVTVRVSRLWFLARDRELAGEGVSTIPGKRDRCPWIHQTQGRARAGIHHAGTPIHQIVTAAYTAAIDPELGALRVIDAQAVIFEAL